MNRTVIGTLSALALSGSLVAGVGASSAAAHDTGATATGTNASDATPPQVKAVTYEGTVALSNCSGSIVKLPSSTDQDPALVLTNGHCLEGGMPSAGQVLVDQPSSRSFTLLNASAGNAGTVRATKLAYGTMTDTDAALYQVNATYAQIKQRYNVNALALSAERPTSGAGIKVVSGYWKRTYTCNADGFVNQLREGPYTWKDSVRYTSPCNVIGGASGSPVIDTASGKVVAVNNTINESGQRSTMNKPVGGGPERPGHRLPRDRLRAADVPDHPLRRRRQQGRPVSARLHPAQAARDPRERHGLTRHHRDPGSPRHQVTPARTPFAPSPTGTASPAPATARCLSRATRPTRARRPVPRLRRVAWPTRSMRTTRPLSDRERSAWRAG